MPFSVTLSSDKSELTFVIDGRFNFSMHADFRNAYKDLPSLKKYIIDLRKATFIDSSAIGMLLLLREHAGDNNADVCLINCSEGIRKIFRISRLDKIFRIG